MRELQKLQTKYLNENENYLMNRCSRKLSIKWDVPSIKTVSIIN
jgi:hypothetical protein